MVIVIVVVVVAVAVAVVVVQDDSYLLDSATSNDRQTYSHKTDRDSEMTGVSDQSTDRAFGSTGEFMPRLSHCINVD